MATDVEKLVVQLSADFKSYENAMAKASGITRKQLAQIKRDAGEVGAAAEGGFRRMSQAAQSSQGNVNSFRNGLSGLGLQAQDVAVQLSMGTDALRVFGQQAPQILSGFGPLGIAIGAAAAALPLLALAFGDSDSAAADFAETSKILEEALKGLTAAGYDVTEATDLFAASLRDIAGVTARAAIEDTRQQVRELASDFAFASEQAGLFAGSDNPLFNREIPQSLQEIQDALIGLANATDDQFAAAAQRVLNVISNIGKETGNITPEMQAVYDAVQSAAQAAATLAGNTTSATSEAGKLAGAWQQVLANAQGAMMAAGKAMAATERVRQAQQTINSSRPTSFGGALGAGPGDFPVSGVPGTPSSILDAQFPVFGAPLAGATAAAGGGGRGGGKSDAQRAAERAAADEQRKIADALRDSIRKVEDAQRDLRRENERTADSFAALFMAAIEGAGDLEDTLKHLMSRIAEEFLSSGLEGLFNANGGSGIFGSIGNAIFGGARAAGGPVTAGRGYLVGERGPELFVPRASGSIVANGKGAGEVAVRVFVDQDGNWRAAVANVAGPVSARVVQRMAPGVVADAQRRSG